MSAQLTYYIFEGVLVGFAGGKTFHIMALSGGRGGTTIKGVETFAVNNPYMTGLETTYRVVSGKLVHGKADVHGGPIPTGRYHIDAPAHHPHLGLAARLTASGRGGRGGFFIHGRGPHGSDGCIVPLNKSQFNGLMAALKKDSGGTLYVEQAMGNSGFA